MKTLLRLLIIAVVTLLPSLAQADSIAFSASSGGAVSFTPGIGNKLSIFNVTIGQVTINGTTSPVAGGLLSILTAPATFSSGTNPLTAVFGPGGTITIDGAVPALGINTVQQLFFGGFLSGAGAQLYPTSTGFFQGNLDPTTLTINPGLIGGTAISGQVTVSVCPQVGGINTCPNLSGSTFYGVESASANAVTTPEPSSIVLLCRIVLPSDMQEITGAVDSLTLAQSKQESV